ncbi:MAG: BatD family protein, partial [Bacteroidales bacterium]|nr:BatD family protein [Bacteroidales bacterium]
DIRYIKSGHRAFVPAGRHLFGTLPYFILLFLPLVLFVLMLIIWRKRIQNRENVAQLRNRRANKVARKSLKKAKVLLAAGKEEEFYVEISRALWGYMSDKFRIPLADLSMDTVRSRLGEKGVADEDIEEFVSTLNECEFARFAPNSGHELMNRLYDLSLQFITKIEKK